MTRMRIRSGRWISRFKRVLSTPSPLPHSMTQSEFDQQLVTITEGPDETVRAPASPPTIPAIKVI